LASDHGLDPLVARLLAGRKVTEPNEALLWPEGSLKDLPDPSTLLGMERATARLETAISGGELICVHGDYDVDGCTSVALLVHFLRRLGANVTWYAPHRQRDGYGVADHTVRRLGEEGVAVLITCDTGVSAHSAITLGNERGIDTIVCDHHTPPEDLPAAHAIINPRLDGEGGPFWELAAIGVSFMLAIALRARLRASGFFADRAEPDLREYLDLVALGTVADLAPLRGVNRLLVTTGLKVLAARRRPGLAALLSASGVGEHDPIDASHLGFRLGPRINASGRLAEAARSVDLMLTEDRQEAEELAELLDGYNKKRQDLERRTYAEALAQIQADDRFEERKGLVLWSDQWHSGVVGIVASRLVHHVQRPTLVIAMKPGEGIGTGSGRAIYGVDLYSVLKRYEPILERFGGHRAAAGLTIREDQLPVLREAFTSEAFEDSDPAAWQASLSLDAELELAQLDWPLYREVQRLAPFGIGNSQPLFALKGAKARRIRALKKGGIRMEIHDSNGHSIDAVGFGLGVRPEDISGPIDLAFHLQENHWRGVTSLELRIRDLRITEQPDVEAADDFS
jgi:single-stranded-DNA-specific exonuclease